MNTFKFVDGKFTITESYGAVKKNKKVKEGGKEDYEGASEREAGERSVGISSPAANAAGTRGAGYGTSTPETMGTPSTTSAASAPPAKIDPKAAYKAKKGAERAETTGGKAMASIYQKTVSPEANKLSSLLVSKAGLNKNDATLLANNFFNYYTKERGQIGKKMQAAAAGAVGDKNYQRAAGGGEGAGGIAGKKATTSVTTTAESKLREGAGNLELKNKLKPFIDYLTKNLPVDKKAALTSPTVLQVLADAVATKTINVPGLTATKAGEEPKAAEKKPEEPEAGGEETGESKPAADPNTIAGQLQLAGVEDIKGVIAKIDQWAKNNQIQIDPVALKVPEGSEKARTETSTATGAANESKYYNPRKVSNMIRHPSLLPYRVR